MSQKRWKRTRHRITVYYINNQIVAEGCVTFHDERDEIHEDESGLMICAALNAYFGFTPDGRDVLEDKDA